jgi:hypothetical protein
VRERARTLSRLVKRHADALSLCEQSSPRRRRSKSLKRSLEGNKGHQEAAPSLP